MGNIYMPQKRLEHFSITNVSKPATSLDLTRDPSVENTLKAVEQSEQALAQTGMDAEVLFSWGDLMQRTILIQSYRAAKAEFELELLRVQRDPSSQAAFIKARDNYHKIASIIETSFPVKEQEKIEILTSAEELSPAAKKATQEQPAPETSASQEAAPATPEAAAQPAEQPKTTPEPAAKTITPQPAKEEAQPAQEEVKTQSN